MANTCPYTIIRHLRERNHRSLWILRYTNGNLNHRRFLEKTFILFREIITNVTDKDLVVEIILYSFRLNYTAR